MVLFLFRSPAHDVMYFGSDGGESRGRDAGHAKCCSRQSFVAGQLAYSQIVAFCQKSLTNERQ